MKIILSIALLFIFGCNEGSQDQPKSETPISTSNSEELILSTDVNITPFDLSGLVKVYNVLSTKSGKISVKLKNYNNIVISNTLTNCPINELKKINSNYACQIAITNNATNAGIYTNQIIITNEVSTEIKTYDLSITSLETLEPTGLMSNVCKPGYHYTDRRCQLSETSCETLPSNSLTAAKIWSDTTKSYGLCQVKTCKEGYNKQNNQCIAFYKNYYNASCNCYKDVPYVDSPVTFTLDGPMNNGTATQAMDIYEPTFSVGRTMVYTHAMNENKEIDVNYEEWIRDEALNNGYTFVSIEYRHPILESAQISIPNDQWDIIYALRKLRLVSSTLLMNSPDDIYSFSYSKGSLLLANITSENPVLYDSFGRVNLKRMFIYDGQITYNFDTYFNNFIDKANVTYYIGPFPFTVSAISAFTSVNNASESATGMKLTTNLNVLDAYRNVSASTYLSQSWASSQPDVYFTYNSADKNRLLKVSEVTTSIVPLVLNNTEADYLLHNPQSAALFCAKYTNKKCVSHLGANYYLNMYEVFRFFNETNIQTFVPNY